MTRARLLLVLLVFLLASTSWLFSQSSEGRILGTVSDQSGAVVSQAQVTVTNTTTNVSRVLLTTSAGEYVASNLEPGPYRVVAEMTGFKKAASTQVLVEVSRDVRIDLKLEAGTINETVEVNAEGSL